MTARVLGWLVGLIVGAMLLVLLAAGFIEAYLLLAKALGLQHALGMDTQTSPNYAFSSGTGPMLIASLGFSSIIAGAMRHVNCEKRGCWRLGHIHPDHGRPVCRKHYHHDVVPH